MMGEKGIKLFTKILCGEGEGCRVGESGGRVKIGWSYNM